MKTLSAAIFFTIILCTCVTAQETISLTGEWTYRLDKEKKGEQEQWFKQVFEKKIKLPGTLDDAGIGDTPAITADKLGKEVLLHLTRKHSYIGYAWYSREIVIPQNWSEKNIELYLERVLWDTKLWIDGKEAGSRESLSAPQRFAVSTLLKPGKHLLTLRIDNSRKYEITWQEMAHAYTDGTQIIWNGVIGKMQLIAKNPTHINTVQVYPSVKNKSVTIKTVLENDGQQNVSGNLVIQVFGKGKKIIASGQMNVQLTPGSIKKEITLSLNEFLPWDEFDPAICQARVELISDKLKKDTRTVSFGMREITNSNSMLQVNGRRLFLRGTLECNIFPLTGHPPMNNNGWLKVFTTTKAYGLNHIRFHSWCPPEAAFEVADSLGIYLQVELPLWSGNAGEDAKVNRFIEEEAVRISEEYGNHPSFCFWSMGNELKGDFNWLTKLLKDLKSSDGRHLYTTTTFSFQEGHGKWPEPDDDYYITQYTKKGWVRGQGIFNTYQPDFITDYTKAIEGLPVPVITHEIGQYSVYPNLQEIKKYTGVLDPLNFKAIQNDLKRKQMLDLAPAYTLASGKFSANLYKEEIERALKTKGMSGFELLDLHDFPGQGTALVGILDAFWDSKGLVTPEEHRRYCSPVVPLIRFAKAVYTNNERFTATAEVANFSNHTIKDGIPVWTAKESSGKIIAQGRLNKQDIAIGNGVDLGTFSFNLSGSHQARAITIELQLQNTSYKNNWTIWVYPETTESHAGEVNFTTTLTTALTLLAQGKNVLLNPDTAHLTGVQGRFAPVFWSPVHFPNQPGTMGILCDPENAALKDFPTDAYSNWQWWDLITSSKTIVLDSLTPVQPIIRVIDNFFKNRQMANIIETRSGKGKLVLVSMDITNNLDKRPVAKQLRYSLERYMISKNFAPAETISVDQLKKLVKE
jgi:hypothetical protein